MSEQIIASQKTPSDLVDSSESAPTIQLSEQSDVLGDDSLQKTLMAIATRSEPAPISPSYESAETAQFDSATETELAAPAVDEFPNAPPRHEHESEVICQSELAQNFSSASNNDQVAQFSIVSDDICEEASLPVSASETLSVLAKDITASERLHSQSRSITTDEGSSVELNLEACGVSFQMHTRIPLNEQLMVSNAQLQLALMQLKETQEKLENAYLKIGNLEAQVQEGQRHCWKNGALARFLGKGFRF